VDKAGISPSLKLLEKEQYFQLDTERRPALYRLETDKAVLHDEILMCIARENLLLEGFLKNNRYLNKNCSIVLSERVKQASMTTAPTVKNYALLNLTYHWKRSLLAKYPSVYTPFHPITQCYLHKLMHNTYYSTMKYSWYINCIFVDNHNLNGAIKYHKSHLIK